LRWKLNLKYSSRSLVVVANDISVEVYTCQHYCFKGKNAKGASSKQSGGIWLLKICHNSAADYTHWSVGEKGTVHVRNHKNNIWLEHYKGAMSTSYYLS